MAVVSWALFALASAPCSAAGLGPPTGKSVPCAPVLACSVETAGGASCQVALSGPHCGEAVAVEVAWSAVTVVPATRRSDPRLVVAPAPVEVLGVGPDSRPGSARRVALKDGVDHEVAAAVRSASGAVLGTARLFLVPGATGWAVRANHPAVEETPIRVRQVRFERRRGPG